MLAVNKFDDGLTPALPILSTRGYDMNLSDSRGGREYYM